jgi:hypothetical protein
MWLYNTNGTIVQLGYSSDNTYNSSIAVPVNLAIAMTNTAYLNVNLTNSPQLLLRWYVTSTSGNPTWKFLIGAGNVSHITVGTIPSANQNYVGTFTGNGTGLTNIPSTGITGLGTAAYSNSTSFAASTVTNLTTGQLATIAAAVTNNANPTFTGLAVGAQTALDVNGNGKFGGVGMTNGVLTGNGSGITNVSASMPSGVASLSIGSLSITNAIILRTNSTIPTLITNASSTYIASASIDPSSNDSLILLNFTTAGSTLANGQYFTITLSQPATSTNSLIVLPMNSINTNQVATANGTLARFLPNTSSNSFSLWSSSTPPAASFSFTYAFLVFRR